MSLPPRTADTMSDAIAMSSPSGRMSKRARDAASRRLAVALFGPQGLTREVLHGTPPKKSPREEALAEVEQFRSYARMAGPRQAKKLNAKADAILASLPQQ